MSTRLQESSPVRSIAADRRERILKGNLRQQVILLAMPTLLQQFLTFCVGMFDTWLSGRIDTAATTSIGVSAYVGWLAGLLVSTVSIGTTAMVSRHCGAGEPIQANKVMNVSLLVAQLFGFLMSSSLYLLAPFFVWSFRLQGHTAEVALNYLRLDAIGHLLTGVTLVGAAALRGSGDMKRPMAVLGAISILNMLLSVSFVYGVGPGLGIGVPVPIVPAMGVYGIAAGTVSARLIGGILMLSVLCVGSDPLKLCLHLLKPDFQIIRRLASLGSYAGLDSLIHWCGQFMFLMIIKRVVVPGVDDDALFAAHIVGIQVEAITFLPAMAWGQAAATLIGQSLGAKKLKRAHKAGLEATMQCCIPAIVMTVVFFFGADVIYRIMHTDAQVIQVGVPAFRAMAWFQVPLVTFLVLRSGLQGAGDTRFPMITTIFGNFMLRLPGAWFFGIYLNLGLMGAWCGMFMDIVFRACMMSWRYLSRTWLRIKV